MTKADYIRQENISVHLVDLPTTVGGFLMDNGDGTRSVYLNSRLPRQRNVSTMSHELDHIVTGQSDDESYREYD